MLLRGVKDFIFWGFLGLSLLFFLFPPAIVEWLYGRILYPAIRLISNLLIWIPLPLIYLMVPLVIFLYIKFIRGSGPGLSKWMAAFKGAAVFIFMFYWLWAFNYRRPDFSTHYYVRFGQLSDWGLRNELNLALDLCIKSRPSTIHKQLATEIESKLKPYVKEVCKKLGYDVPGNIRAKEIYPAGTLLRIKTAGFYMPFCGEAYVDAGLHILQLPYTLAHEMSHAAGITDEGACNFTAYLASINQPDSLIIYSAAISYYRYVATSYRHYFPNEYDKFKKQIPKNIANDLNEVTQQMLKYPDVFPRLRDAIYDRFLSLQGVKGGMASYDHVIDYVKFSRDNGIWLFNNYH